jgi:head-tail adaptor
MITPNIGELQDVISIINVTSPYKKSTMEGTLVSTHASNIRAKIEPLGGEMYEETQAMQTYRQSYRIWIRYLAGVTAFQQITYGTKRLIMNGPPEDFGRWLLIHAEERFSRTV